MHLCCQHAINEADPETADIFPFLLRTAHAWLPLGAGPAKHTGTLVHASHSLIVQRWERC